jgi:hypothetical protein
MKKILLLGALISVVLTSGCSTLTGEGTGQNLTVLTYNQTNKDLNGAKCELTNDEGSWSVITPGSTMIHRSNKDLRVICTKEGHKEGRANVVSDTKANMFGNIIFGGGIGAIIDHNNGSAYAYPDTLKVVMGVDSLIKVDNQISETAENQN